MIYVIIKITTINTTNMRTPWSVRTITIADCAWRWKRRQVLNIRCYAVRPADRGLRMMGIVPHARAMAGSPPPALLSKTGGRRGDRPSSMARLLSLAKLLRPSLPYITRKNKRTLTGGHSNQNPRRTQKPIHNPIFTHHIRS